MKWKLLKRRMAVLLSALVITSSIPVYAEAPENQPTEVSDPANTETPKTNPSTEASETNPSSETLETPSSLETPETPPSSETPETPSGSETPQTPSSSETPETPPSSETPETPSGSETPQTPSSSETPETNPGSETPETPSNSETDWGYNFHQGMARLYKKTETDEITVLPGGSYQSISMEDGIQKVRLQLLDGFAANEKYCLNMQAHSGRFRLYVGEYDSEPEAENATFITLGGNDYYEADFSKGVLFTYFYNGNKYYVNFIAVPYKTSSDSSSSSDNTSGSDSSSSSDNTSGSDSSSSSDNASTTDGDNTVSVAPVVSDVKTFDSEISVAGSKIKASVAGVYAAKKVQGAAVTNPYADVRSKLKLSDSQTPYIMIFDTDTKKSNKAMDSINAAMTALGNAKIAATLNIDLGARERGRYVSLSEGSLSIVVGLPKGVDTTKSVSIICVRPGGQITILEDMDTNPNTVTFEIQAGLGTYAIITQ